LDSWDAVLSATKEWKGTTNKFLKRKDQRMAAPANGWLRGMKEVKTNGSLSRSTDLWKNGIFFGRTLKQHPLDCIAIRWIVHSGSLFYDAFSLPKIIAFYHSALDGGFAWFREEI
jgi:hypothetical protein